MHGHGSKSKGVTPEYCSRLLPLKLKLGRVDDIYIVWLSIAMDVVILNRRI